MSYDDLHLGYVTYVDLAPQSLIFEKISRSEDVPDMTPEPYLLLFAQKLALVRNQSIFASSEAETCSARISATSHSFPIILVDLKCTCQYLLHNVVYMAKSPGIKFPCERPPFETVQTLELFPGRNLHM